MTTPTKVGLDTDWAEISTGGDSSYARKTDRTLWAWGLNAQGRLGLGPGASLEYGDPTKIGSDSDWATISASVSHTMATKTSGALWAWGNNAYGQLDSIVVASDAPLRIGSGTNWVVASSGGFHIVALRDAGGGNLSLWTWGRDQHGQVGIGCVDLLSCVDVETPTAVGSDTWRAVAGGYTHSLAIRSDGSLWAWGDNIESQLGDASTSDEYSPVRVAAPDWYSVAGGERHSVALKSDGTLYHWGTNTNDRFIEGGASPVLTPTRIGYQ